MIDIPAFGRGFKGFFATLGDANCGVGVVSKG